MSASTALPHPLVPRRVLVSGALVLACLVPPAPGRAADADLKLTGAAAGQLDRTYAWTIEKSVEAPRKEAVVAATFAYTVVARRDAGADGGHVVNGVVEVQNPSLAPVTADVTASLPGCDFDAVAPGVQGTRTWDDVAIGMLGAHDLPFHCRPATAVPGPLHASATWLAGGVAETTVGADLPVPWTVHAHDADASVADVFDGVPLPALPAADCAALGVDPAGARCYLYHQTVGAPERGCRAHVNTATVTAVDSHLAASASATAEVCRSERATLELAKAASRDHVLAGTTVRFTLTVRVGPDAAASELTVCDRLPSSMTFVRAPGATFRKGAACWTRTALKPGAVLRFAVVARVDRGTGAGTACNRASATAGNAATVRARACVAVAPRRDALRGTVGVTG